jgi:putative oxidoreductase
MSISTTIGQKIHKPDAGLLVVRLAFGLILVVFGFQKLLGGTDGFRHLGEAMGMFGIHFAPVFWGVMSALTESLGGLMIILGLLFRPAALLLFFNMIVACAVMWHGGPDFGSVPALGSWLQTFAMPFTFAATFLALLLIGPGKYALGKAV